MVCPASVPFAFRELQMKLQNADERKLFVVQPAAVILTTTCPWFFCDSAWMGQGIELELVLLWLPLAR